NLATKAKGDLISLATDQERTLFFDFLFVDLGLVRGMRTRLQLYTVPGQVYYETMRRKVLKGADAVVFVCDSQAALLEANIASFDSLRENIIANELDLNLPLVMQYNKRDLPTALPVSVLNGAINPRGIAPAFEAVATQGVGVEDTLKGITKRLFASLADLYGTTPASPSAEEEAAASRAVAVSTSLPVAHPGGATAPAARAGNGAHEDPAPQ